MTSGEMITRIQQELKGLTTRFVEVDYTNAVTGAIEDTGWSFPVTTNYRIKWMSKRTKRHLFEMLQSQYSIKFKVDGINLQHRFDHYSKLVQSLDEEWEKEQDQMMPDDASGIGGIRIDNGFIYDTNTEEDVTDQYESTATITPTVSE